MFGARREKVGQEAACQLNKEFGENKAFFLKCDVTKHDELESKIYLFKKNPSKCNCRYVQIYLSEISHFGYRN